jgi:hypothetical protein
MLSSIRVRMDEDTVWLTQQQICELFDKSKSTISEHIKNVFEEGELRRDSVVRKIRTTAADGKSYETLYYNLDVIISVWNFRFSIFYRSFSILIHQKSVISDDFLQNRPNN